MGSEGRNVGTIFFQLLIASYFLTLPSEIYVPLFRFKAQNIAIKFQCGSIRRRYVYRSVFTSVSVNVIVCLNGSRRTKCWYDVFFNY